MATTDAATLLSQSACYACFSEGEQMLMVLRLWANVIAAPPVNLLAGQNYNAFSSFVFTTLVVGATYHLIMGANDNFAQSGTMSISSGSATFTAIETNLRLGSIAPNVPVTAQLYRVS